MRIGIRVPVRAFSAAVVPTAESVVGQKRSVRWFEFGSVNYAEAWAWQRSLLKARVALQASDRPRADVVLTLEHPHVFTLGRAATEADLRFDVTAEPRIADVHRVERGGQVTYHGPGQLVVYPILQLRVRGSEV